MFNQISSQALKLVEITKNKKIDSITKVITLTSGKGGVGKTTLAVNFANIMVQRGYKIGLLDADIGLANLQVHLNVKPAYTISDYVNGQISLENLFINTEEGITLIAGKSGYEKLESSTIVYKRLIEEVLKLNKFDFLLIDTGAGLNEQVHEFLNIANNIVAVTTTDPSALTDVYALMKLLSDSKNEIMLCFNQTNRFETGAAITKQLINLAKKNKFNSKFMIQYLGNIDNSNTVCTTGRLRKTYTNEFRNDLAAIQMSKIVDKILMKI